MCIFIITWLLLACVAAIVALRHTEHGAEAAKHAQIISAVVLLSILSGVAAAYTAASPVAFVELCACHAVVLAAAIIDAKERIIPNALPASLVVVRIACFAYEYFFSTEALGFLASSLLGGLLCFVALSFAGKVSHGGIGGGDVKLITAMGFACGLYFIVYALTIALVVGAVAAAALLLVSKRQKEDSLPFAPFLYVGFVGAVMLSLL